MMTSQSTSPGRRRWWVSLVGLLAVLLPAGVVSTSAADPGDGSRHPRQSVAPAGDVVLRWRADEPLPMGDARPEFRLGGRLLGYPRISADQTTLTLRLDAKLRSPAAVSVWLSGRRLDARGVAREADGAPYVEPVPSRVLKTDPGRPGPFQPATYSYRLPSRPMPGFREPVEMVGHVVAPLDAPGTRPFVLFLHGRHYTCFVPGTDRISGNWPCKSQERPVPSHLGYRYTQHLLATQGYVTVSISANGINGQDWRADDGGAAARSLLVRRHLRLWASWATTGEAPAELRNPVGRADLERVLLVGHSRGGEGVDRAAIDTSATAPWDIDGQVLIGPTAFGRQEAPYVPTVVMLPYCDGDVIDLQGQAYVDTGRDVLRDPALRSSVMVMGANHNYFNTEWTPGISRAPSFDDWYDRDDPVCGRGQDPRLTAREQRAVGKAYVAGAARLLLRGDERVLPLYDGSRARVESAGDADVRTHALGARRSLIRPGARTEVVASPRAQARLCEGRSEGRAKRYCGAGYPSFRTPHWPAARYGKVVPTDKALELGWDAAGARGGLILDSPVDFSSASSLDARVVVDPRRGPVQVDVRVVDAAGHRAVLTPLRQGRLAALPGRSPLGKLWAQTLRVPLADVGNVDLAALRRVDVIARSEQGRVWVLDLAGRRPGLRTVPDRIAPRVDLGSVSVAEGDGPGPGTLNVPVTVHGTLSQPARLSVQVVDFTADRGELPPPYVLRLAPGQRHAVIPISFERDNRDDIRLTEYSVIAYPLRGVMTGDYLGSGQVRDDDPTPAATLSVVDGSVSEGEPAQWRIRLAKPVDYAVSYRLPAVNASDGHRPLRTNDVPKRWLRRHLGEMPEQPVSLAKARLTLYESIRAGERSVLIPVPTVADRRSEEKAESLALRVGGHPTLAEPQTVEVLVRD
jgi:hypothetical protein